MTSLAHSPNSSLSLQRLRTPFTPLSRSHHCNPLTDTVVPIHPSSNQMETPRSSSSLLQPFIHGSAGSSTATSASPDASFGSDSDDEQDEVPSTPGNNDRFAFFARQAGVRIATSALKKTTCKIVEPSWCLDGRDGKHQVGGEASEEVFKPSHPAEQILSPDAKSFFPSFDNFLPSIEQAEEERKKDLTAFSWSPSSEDNKENDLDSLARRTAAFSLSYRHERKQSFDPCGQFGMDLDKENSFTFFPSPGFRSPDAASSASTKPTSTSSSLLSPKPANASRLPRGAPAAPLHHQDHHRSLSSLASRHHHRHSHISLPGFPATPPGTPARQTLPRLETPSSLPYFQQQQQQPAPQLPAGYFGGPVSLPPTPESAHPSYFAAPISHVPAPSPLVAVPIPASPAPPSTAINAGEADGAYPLSSADTDRIAKLHNGRVPSLQQLAPPEVMVSSGAQPPIVNTGNQGQMIVQAGDWRCGVCAFVNWRRRKICLRCFPYANDIGNILTIQSQRAAYLAHPTPSRSTVPANGHVAASLPSTGGSATFHIQPALPAYSSTSIGGASSEGGGGIPSAHLAAMAMARTSTHPPPSTPRSAGEGPGSLVYPKQYGYPPYATPPPRSCTSPWITPSPRPYPPANVAPQQPHVFHAYSQQYQQSPVSPLPAVIWSQQDDPSSPSNDSSSAGGLSATSAGEHAAFLRARQALVAKEKASRKVQEGIRCFPSLPSHVGTGVMGWGRAAMNGYVAPGPMAMAEL
ncbi:hypothetical protein JCM11251_007674 [Rhodosporidiobolus azoricus]